MPRLYTKVRTAVPAGFITKSEAITWPEWIHDKTARWAQFGTWAISILALTVSIVALVLHG